MDEKQIQQLQREHTHRGEVIQELSHMNGELQTELLSVRLQMKRLQEHLRNMEAQKSLDNHE